MKVPAVSIIIPLYNAEKYIGECLESVLNQTFQNFEVIVVGDCSTDSSCAIVKSYAPKFNGRLTLTKTQKNSGNPGEPSNIGIYLSRGEYLLILDNDDAITSTALEELYPIAKKFKAEVVACEKYYQIPEKFWHDAKFRRQLKPWSYKNGDFVTEPTFIPFELAERVKACEQREFLWNIWTKLIRRDFLIKNNIRFNQEMIQDMLFTCCLIYTAERYVRVPNAINFYRVLDDSLSHKNYSGEEFLIKYVRALTTGFNFLDKFLSEREFFEKNSALKYLALKVYVNEILMYLEKIYKSNPAYVLDDILRQEFGRGDNLALVAFTFNDMNLCRLRLIQAQQQINDL